MENLSVTESVVVTGIGLVTPLGSSVGGVLDRIERGDVVALRPAFDMASFACPCCAPVVDFDPETYFPENKTLRLMDRGAQMAAAAAHTALEDAGVQPDATYPAEEIALYGSTGASSLPASEVSRIVGDAVESV